jgi:acyl-CoA thioester hydrolase
MSALFCYRFRVRYQECDAQKIVFNARWGDYVDIATTELCRTAFGAPEAVDWKLARQVMEWKASARFDDVLEARTATTKLGTTSLVLRTEFYRLPEERLLATAETVYVMTDPVAGTKRPLTEDERRVLGSAAIAGLVDCSGSPLKAIPGEGSSGMDRVEGDGVVRSRP